MLNKDVYDQKLMDMIRMTAPGTQLREGLDNVLRARTGGLIVIGKEENTLPLAEGGFYIDAPYTPAHLYELAKMDGAIFINNDCTRIVRANAHLNPDPGTPSNETGIRHRTAEQTARQTGELVISISQRRELITLYKGKQKYVLRDTVVLLNKASQALETMDKYKTVLAEALVRLSVEEFDNIVVLFDVLQVIQRAEMLKRVERELTVYISELGNEGRLIDMQAKELIANVDFDERQTLRDYAIFHTKTSEKQQVDGILKRLQELDGEDLLILDNLANLIGYDGYHDENKRTVLYSRGYRLLHRIPRIPSHIIDNVVDHFSTLENLIKASTDELDEVEGVGPVRARQISVGLERLHSQTAADRHWI